MGNELATLLSPAENDSVRATTYNAFYTAPAVMRAMHDALTRLGVPDKALILEPGCGVGNFIAQGKPGQRFIGVEKNSLSGRIARALHSQADIRIESFEETLLPEVDSFIGNPLSWEFG